MLSVNQWNKINASKTDGRKSEEEQHFKFLSEFLDSNPNVYNKDVGLGDLDPQYSPQVDGKTTNKVKDVLKEVNQNLPNTDVDKLTNRDPLLAHYLKDYIHPKSKTLSKNLESLPVK